MVVIIALSPFYRWSNGAGGRKGGQKGTVAALCGYEKFSGCRREKKKTLHDPHGSAYFSRKKGYQCEKKKGRGVRAPTP